MIAMDRRDEENIVEGPGKNEYSKDTRNTID